MALYSLLDLAGCGQVAIHYAGVAIAGERLDLSKTYDIHGNYATFACCSSCGRILPEQDVRVDWFFPEVIH